MDEEGEAKSGIANARVKIGTRVRVQVSQITMRIKMVIPLNLAANKL